MLTARAPACWITRFDVVIASQMIINAKEEGDVHQSVCIPMSKLSVLVESRTYGRMGISLRFTNYGDI